MDIGVKAGVAHIAAKQVIVEDLGAVDFEGSTIIIHNTTLIRLITALVATVAGTIITN